MANFRKRAGGIDRPARSVAVVGAGISGLAAAYKLKSNDVNVTVFEVAEQAGGKIRSVSQAGFVWDEGANTMTENEMEVSQLIDNLGLREQQQFPISQKKRYIAKNGSPNLIPSNPIALITSNFLSTKSKIQVALEPLMWKRSNEKIANEYSEESVGQFFQRHFGEEVVDLLIDPIVAGTSGGDPESLSMRHAFPEIWNLEKLYGSIIAGAIKCKLLAKHKENGRAFSKRKGQHGSFSFKGGMQTLVDMLCSKLGKDNLKLCHNVLSLSYEFSETGQDWSIYTDKKDSIDQYYDAIIMTAPMCNLQEMEFRKGAHILDLGFLPKVRYVPLSVLVTSFRKENVKKPLEGFGVLIPSQEQASGLKTLGTLFSSAMFPDRAPTGQLLFTTFIGGSRNNDLAGASSDELKQIVTQDLQKLLGVEGQPTFLKHVYWKTAFPLYSHDYELVLEGIKKLEENLPGFFYAGNHKDGLSVGKAIVSGCKAADSVLSYLNSRLDGDAS